METDDRSDTSDNELSPVNPAIDKLSFRKRSSRACDQCRKTKSRCDPPRIDGPCKACKISGTACTYQGATQKRGPPKGYLLALDTRLHEAEALLGAIIASSKAEPLVGILSEDPLAQTIINRVKNSIFGTAGRPSSNNKPPSTSSRGRRRPDKERQRMSSSQIDYLRENGNPVFTGPSYLWQDHLVEQLDSEVHGEPSVLCSRCKHDTSAPSDSTLGRRQKRRTEFPETVRSEISAQAQPTVHVAPYNGIDLLSQNLADREIGKLLLDEYHQITYHGEASGLTLLGQVPRNDALYLQKIWRLPQRSLYPLGLDIRPTTYEELEKDVTLPARSVQEHLLRQYFHYVHPIFPIVHRDNFWDEWTVMHRCGSGGPAKLLLLAMFALASRYVDHGSPGASNFSFAAASRSYMEDAKSILKQVYGSSRLSTCQSLLLLACHDIGLCGIANASVFIAMAIQMAQDLGLHRHADQWGRDGTRVFSERHLQLRRAVWYGCVVLDVYVSAQQGRPVHIRDDSYDTRLPEVDLQEDFQIWLPYRNVPTAQKYHPLPGRITGCFHSLSSLAQIFSVILQKLYAVKSNYTVAEKHDESFKIDQQLQRWYLELPESLRFIVSSAASPVPPPQVLCLHMFYWCAVLLLQRAFIQLQPGDPQLPLRRALDLSAAAATNLTNIVCTYNSAFGLRHCPALLTYYLMNAGVMHITILHIYPTDVPAKLGLGRCLRGLDDMKDIWPAALQIYAFLSGANVDAENQPPGTSRSDARSLKRQLDGSVSEGSGNTYTRSGSIPSVSSSAVMDLPHPASFMQLAHSLGLESNALDKVFDSSYDWPLGDGVFHNSEMHLDTDMMM